MGAARDAAVTPDPPPVGDLSKAQYDGWACCWCGSSLLSVKAVPAGVSRGSSGVHVLDIEVWACPGCAVAPQCRTEEGSPAARAGRIRGT